MGRVWRLLTLVLGLVLAVAVLDDASRIDVLARLAGTDDAAVVAGLAYLFALLVFAGAVLAFPAPRGAAIVLLVGGVLGLVLGRGTIWENALVWGGASLALALVAWLGHRAKRRGARRRAIARGRGGVVAGGAPMEGGGGG